MIIGVTNLKGGVGKSTISRNIAAYFSYKVDKVCIVDTDTKQRTSSKWASRRGEDVPNISIFPMSTVKGLVKDVETHKQNGYDIIVIDGVPKVDEVNTKILLLSDFVIMPISPSIDDLEAVEEFLELYENAQAFRDIPAYLLLNRNNDRTSEAEEALEVIEMFEEAGVKNIDVMISDLVSHRRASKSGLTAYEWTDKKAKKQIKELGEKVEDIITLLAS